MMKYLIPKIKFRDLILNIYLAAFGAILAGLYGVVHDQVTYSISHEYFTKFKFQQFHYANLGLGDRVFAGTIGFLATWWVGFFVAWFLGRRLIPDQPREIAIRQVLKAISVVFGVAIAFGVSGYLLGYVRGPNADYSAWESALSSRGVKDIPAFVQVAYIHNAGYLGGVVGLGLALWLIRPVREHEK